MKLYRKTLAISGVILLCIMIILYLISKTLLLTSFAKLENNSAQKDISRTVNSLNDEISVINRSAGDWAAFDDSYTFIENENREYISKNLPDEAFTGLKLDLIVYVNSSSKIVYLRNYDYQKEIDLPDSPSVRGLFTPNSRLLQHSNIDSSVSGVIMLPEGPMMIASRPILTSEKTGPIRGSLIMGRYLDQPEIENLAKVTNLILKSVNLNEIQPIKDNLLASSDATYIYPKNSDELNGYALIRDINNNPAFALEVDLTRDISKQGWLVFGYLFFSLAMVGLVLTGVFILLLNKMVLSRVTSLSKKVQAIGEKEDLKARVELNGNDELNLLADSVNKMLEALYLSKENYRAIFETTGTVTMIIDATGRILKVNSEFEKFFCFSKQESEGNLFWEDLGKIDLGEEVKNIRELLYQPEQQRLSLEARLILRDGSRKDVIVVISKITGAKRMVCSILDITKRKEMEESLKHISLHDPLTGLYNRAYFEDTMKRLNSDIFPSVGLIVCDVDGLKIINDSLGHSIGDNVLRNTADILRGSFREEDLIARIGGDEFVVLIPDATNEVVEGSIIRLQKRLEQYNDEAQTAINLSIGFQVKKYPHENMDELFKQADYKMYRGKLHRSQSTRSNIVKALMKAIEVRDFLTEGHGERLENLAAQLGRVLGLSQHKIADLRLLAQFHDIGKVGVPDHILFKPNKLTTAEMEEMKRHSEIGYLIAASVPDLLPIADWILKHHEWWNGEGYPKQIKGEKIPLECRILAIVDAYDAMTNDRPYRKAMSQREAIDELMRGKGIQFDSYLVDEFVKMLEYKEIDLFNRMCKSG